MQQTGVEPEAQFAVYLVDPGPQPARIVPFLEEVTGRPLEECAELLQRSPALVSLFHTRVSAEDLVARCREFEAIAIIRPASEPVDEVEAEPFAPAPVQRALHVVLVLLGAAQLYVGVQWIREQRLLTGIAGLIFGALVMGYFLIQLRRSA